MVLLSGGLRFVQETRSGNVADKLLGMLHTTACVEREGQKAEIPLEELVVGDLVHLSAGGHDPRRPAHPGGQGLVRQPVRPDGRK